MDSEERELDYQVAREIYGRKVIDVVDSMARGETCWTTDAVYDAWHRSMQVTGLPSVVPRFSTTYAAAFDLVHHMRSLGWRIEIKSVDRRVDNLDLRWQVMFWQEDKKSVCSATTLSRAIVVAALGAVDTLERHTTTSISY